MKHPDREGFWWGIVVSTNDPENRHRIQCRIPDVLGNELSEWAEPDSMILAPLKPGDKLWIRFRGGDTRRPVYHIPHKKERAYVWNDPAEAILKNPSGNTLVTGTTSSVRTADGKVHAMGPDAQGYVPVAATYMTNPASSAVVLSGGKVHTMGPNATGYVACVASVHEIGSDPNLKHDIRPLDFDPVEAIRNAPATLWKYLPEHSEDQRDHIGPMLSDLPEVVKSGSNLDTQAVLGIAWAAIARLIDRVESLEAEIAALNNE